MKKYVLFIAVIAVIAGCSKKEINNDPPIDIWNGYGHLKSANPIATLYAGKTIDVGTVTYGIEQIGTDCFFTATYNLTGGWEMSESHLFAGEKDDMPLNKPGNPKIGRFPFAADHSPMVTEYTYEIPIGDLPPCEDPGFTTAAHCAVQGPNGQQETAWRLDDEEFPGKRWGWYGRVYESESNDFTTLYGTEYSTDGTLNVYLINVTTGQTTHLLSEDIGTQGSSFDGTAYDEETGYLIFVDISNSTMYGINLNDESVVEPLGTLSGTTSSATFYDGNYYFVEDGTNNLVEVSFDANMQIVSQTPISTVPISVSVQDITMDLSGSSFYMIGNVNDGTSELIILDVGSDIYASSDIAVNQGSQISIGSDNVLYVVEPTTDDPNFYSLDPNSGTLSPIDNNSTEEVDPFLDLAKGPLM